MASDDVQIILKAVDRASKQIDRVEKSIEKLGNKVQTTSKKMKQSTSAVKDLQAGWGKLVATGMAVAGALYSIKKAYDFAKEGASLEFAASKFDRLSVSIGATSKVLMTDLKDATRGMVSDSELVQSAGDFMSLGLAKTSDEVIRLTRVAGAMGMDMNQLVLTLTNQTTMRFDALGVAVDGFDAKVDKLKKSGMSASEAFKEAFLQQAEQQIARVGDAADGATAEFVKMEVSWKNLKDTMLKKIEATIVVTEIRKTVDALNQQVIVLDELKRMQDWNAISGEQLLEIRQRLRLGTMELADAEYIAERALMAWHVLTKKLGPDVEGADRAMLGLAGTFNELAVDADSAASSIRGIAFSLGEVTKANIAAMAQKELQEAYANTNLTAEEFIALNREVGRTILGLSPSVLDANEKFYRMQVAFASSEISGNAVINMVQGLNNQLNAIPNVIPIEFRISTTGKIPKLGGKDKTAVEAYGGATGLEMTVPPGYSESGGGRPFLFAAESGENITITPGPKRGGGSGGVTNIFFKIVQLPGEDGMALAGRIERNKQNALRSGAGYAGAH